MNKTFVCVLVLLLAQSALAAQTPYSPELEAALGQVNSVKVAKVVYDVAGNGGSSTAHGLGVFLPANAAIIRDYLYVNTKFEQSNGQHARLTLGCETAANILSVASLTNAASGTYLDGVSSGASTVFKPITAQCEVTATPTIADYSAGKATLFISYIVRE